MHSGVIKLTLSAEEISALAGGYRRPSDQLRELHRQGFYRARLGVVNKQVILERAHYDAVCAGAVVSQLQAAATRPQLRATK
jgi:hypothetical protein